jgi:hypothetical protein
VKNVIHAFSVEMKSKQHVKNISISDEAHDRVLFEGNLGELLELSLEGDVFELVGVNGVLRVGLTKKQLMKTRLTNRETSLSSEVGSYTSTKKERRVKKE